MNLSHNEAMSKETWIQAIQNFSQSVQENLKALSAARSDTAFLVQVAELKDILHKIKGLAGTMGKTEIFEALYHCERAAFDFSCIKEPGAHRDSWEDFARGALKLTPLLEAENVKALEKETKRLSESLPDPKESFDHLNDAHMRKLLNGSPLPWAASLPDRLSKDQRNFLVQAIREGFALGGAEFFLPMAEIKSLQSLQFHEDTLFICDLKPEVEQGKVNVFLSFLYKSEQDLNRFKKYISRAESLELYKA
jgi:hypothetical protein